MVDVGREGWADGKSRTLKTRNSELGEGGLGGSKELFARTVEVGLVDYYYYYYYSPSRRNLFFPLQTEPSRGRRPKENTGRRHLSEGWGGGVGGVVELSLLPLACLRMLVLEGGGLILEYWQSRHRYGLCVTYYIARRARGRCSSYTGI